MWRAGRVLLSLADGNTSAGTGTADGRATSAGGGLDGGEEQAADVRRTTGHMLGDAREWESCRSGRRVWAGGGCIWLRWVRWVQAVGRPGLVGVGVGVERAVWEVWRAGCF